MTKNLETFKGAKRNFLAGYEMIPAKFQIKVKERIMKRCGWSSLMTFHNKRKGDHCIKPLEILVIEQEFSRYGINPWTGDNLILKSRDEDVTQG
jgi:ribosomal protein S27AE